MHYNKEKHSAGSLKPRGLRLPYVAPIIETHLVELEGGIAAGSARLKNDGTGNFTFDDYEDSGTVTRDVELM